MMVPTYTLASAIQQSVSLVNDTNNKKGSPYSGTRDVTHEEPLSTQRLLMDHMDSDRQEQTYDLTYFHWDPTIADIARKEGVS